MTAAVRPVDPTRSNAEDAELARVLDAYLAGLEAGRPADPDALVAAHPAIADRLRRCLDSLGLIQQAAAQGASPAGDAHAPGAPTLGDFRILREVGRGGMGVVYEAEQLSLGRRVALKVLPFAAALDAQQLARFKLEAQAAAQLHHTHIVPVYSVGVERGVHYYAMQFIEGRSLADLIRDLRQPDAAPGPSPTAPASPSPRTRDFHRTAARLGIQAAEALEHAHRFGILHRDVKPANLLVDLHGNLWITDFGLARLGVDANLTLSGDVLGTLRYLSPERAAGSRVGYDQRTDVYALGVTLYELLTLRPAFDGHDRADLLRRIAADEPPSPRKLDPSISADLETIVLKAMAKDPEGRYASAQDLADDLRRFLEHKPIRARRPTLRQRAAKWARRHAAWVAAGAMALLLAVIGLAIGYLRVSREQDRTRAALRRAEDRTRQARRAVDEMYTRFARDWLANQPKLEPVQREFLEEAMRFYQEFARENADDPDVQAEAARAHARVGEIQQKLGRTREADAAYRRAIAMLEPLEARFPRTLTYRHDLANNLNNLGVLAKDTGRLAEAERALRRSASMLEALAAADPGEGRYRLHLGGTYSNLGALAFQLGRPADAEQAFRKSVATFESLAALLPSEPEVRLKVAIGHINLSTFLERLGRTADAEESAGRALARFEALAKEDPANPDYRRGLVLSHSNLGKLLAARGQHAEAEQHTRRAIAEARRLMDDFPDVVIYRREVAAGENQLGSELEATGRAEDAASAYRRAVELMQSLASDAPDVPDFQHALATTSLALGISLARKGERAEASKSLDRAAGILERLTASSPATAEYRATLALVLLNRGELERDSGHPDDAERSYRRSLALGEALAAEVPTRADYQTNASEAAVGLAKVLLARGEAAEARAVLSPAFDRQKATLKAHPRDPDARRAFATLADGLDEILGRLGDPEERHRIRTEAAALLKAPDRP